MARKKKTTEANLETTAKLKSGANNDLENEIETSDENEQALDDGDESEEKVEEAKPKRAPRRRTTRARKPRNTKARNQGFEGSLLAAMSSPSKTVIESEPVTAEMPTPVEEPAAEAPTALEMAVAAEVTKGVEPGPDVMPLPEPTPSPRPPRPGPVWEPPSEPLTFQAETKPGGSTVDHDLESFAKNLARVNTILHDFSSLPKEIPKGPVARPPFITKVAVGMSAFAIILSLISVSLSRSAQIAAVEKPVPVQRIAETVNATPPLWRPDPPVFRKRPVAPSARLATKERASRRASPRARKSDRQSKR